jgi:hypothetical protein
MSMFESIQRAMGEIPHPIFVGCVAIGLGVLATGFASPFKSKADRAQKSRVPATRTRARAFRAGFISLLIIGAILSGFGTWLTINGARADAAVQVAAAQKLLDQTRKDNDQARKEFDSKLQTVLVALNAAKQEQTRLLTEEKIKVIRNDFLQWAQDFANRKPDKQRQFEQAKIAQKQQEIQITAESMPLFSFTIKFVQEALRAYSKQAGKDFKVDLPGLPENFYSADANKSQRVIQFTNTAGWSFTINANLPAREDVPPILAIQFTDSGGRNGFLYMTRIPNATKFRIWGSGTLPEPQSSTIFGDYEMENYEDAISRAFRPLIEGQLLDTP